MDNPSCRDDSEYAPPLPPLVWPKTNLDDSQHNGDASRRLRPGCYVVDCKLLGIDEPIGTNQYFGTMRLEIGESGVRFSGDLYLQHPESLVVGQLARGAINSIRSLLDRPIAIETVKKNIRTLQLARISHH